MAGNGISSSSTVRGRCRAKESESAKDGRESEREEEGEREERWKGSKEREVRNVGPYKLVDRFLEMPASTAVHI